MTTISSGLSNVATRNEAMQRGGTAHRLPRGEGGPQGAQRPSLDALFSQIDADGSGSISADELKTAMQPGDVAGRATSGSDTSASANCLSGMGMNTQDFASMMGSGMPPPPPDAAEGAQDLFQAIDGNSDGDLSQIEVQDFEKKLRALFDHMQRMGTDASAAGDEASSALSVTA